MKHTITFSLGIALLSASLGMAHAQRAPIDRTDRRAQRQQMMEGMTPEQRAQFFQNRRQQRNAAQGENGATGNGFTQNGATQGGQVGNRGGQGGQRANGGRTRNRNGNSAQSAADREAQMRALMTSAGITDKAQQDPIVTFVFAQAKAREPLLKNARDVATSLRDDKSTPDQISAKWTAYQGALSEDKTRFEKELAALDEQIGWSKDARLQSFLSLVGVLSPDASMIGGAGAIFTPEPQARTVATQNATRGTTDAATAARNN